MKKLMSSIIALAIAVLFTANTSAAPLILAYDGAVHNYLGKTYSLKVNGEAVPTDIPSVIINDRALVPARAVFEKLGATVNWDGANQKVLVGMNSTNVELKINDKNAIVNNKKVELDVPAKIINDRTMIPARFVAENLNMKVGWLPDDNLITIDQTTLKNVTYSQNGSQEIIAISVDYYKNYNIFKLSDPDRIVIDFPNTKASNEQQRLDINSATIKSARYRQFENNAARIVLDVYSNTQYQVQEKEGQLLLYLSGGQVDRGGDVRVPTPTPTPVQSPTLTPSPAPTPTPTPVPVQTPNATPLPLNENSKIEHIQKGAQDEVLISLASYKGYKVVRVTDPDRLVIDIPNTSAPSKEQKMTVSSNRIKAVRYAQFENSIARIVIDMAGQSDYQVEERNGQLAIIVKNPTYGNLVYHSNGDRIYFTLKWTQLTKDEHDVIKKLYTEKYDSTGKTYSISFKGYATEFGNGTMKINDSLLDSVAVSSNTAINETVITFNAKDKFVYEIITRYDPNGNVYDTAITLLKPASKADKLVVIDPGHGGFETGAAPSPGFLEKDLNIDIAKRLNALLKSKGVKTYMIREDDPYVGLYERAYIANDLNAALFISIHNNAFDKVSYGTETFYYAPNVDESKFNSRRLAQIVQQELLKALNSYDRRVKTAGFVVIKKTKMPSILTEIGFMDNKEDAEKLKKDEYRQKAAVGLCDAIIKALSEVN